MAKSTADLEAIPKEMNLSEAKLKCSELKIELELLVKKFESETGLIIENLEIQRYTIGGHPTIGLDVRLYKGGR